MDTQAVKKLVFQIIENNSEITSLEITGNSLEKKQSNLVLAIQLVDLMQEKEMGFEQACDFYLSNS